jgi:asparaginyl-tRNA synthetase
MVDMHIAETLKGKEKKAKIKGWIYRKREQKEAVFLIIRDSSGVIQTVSKRDSPSWKDAQKATIESSVEIEGDVKKDKRAPGGYEIQIQKLKIVGLAETFPIGRDLSDEFLLDVRHLWLRSQKMTSILKVRSKVFSLSCSNMATVCRSSFNGS